MVVVRLASDADVQVGQHLRDLLEQEVNDATRQIQQQKGNRSGHKSARCVPGDASKKEATY